MYNDAGDLRIVGNEYYVQAKRRFLAYSTMLASDKNKCFDFAFDMSYGKKGKHRNYRSGGSVHRTEGQIFINTFQGKMAEYAMYRYLKNKYIESNEPDVRKFGLGIWDSFDLTCQEKHISIKSTKSYGDLLLLETKDWNDEGSYTPNQDKGSSKYDFIVLVRFSPDGEQIMKENKFLYQKGKEIPGNIKDILIEKVRDINWKYDFPGFIYYNELVNMIRDNRIIPKNSMLNGKIPMDAENYYFQTGNMHQINELYSGNDVTDSVLIRKCPKCGNRLVIRNGQYGKFWGCEGYYKSINCRFIEKIK